MSITKGPLNGIRIIDMTQAHAGPFGTMLLGDLGAEIIKLEPPTGELMRLGNPKVSVTHYYMIGLNRNKKGLALDLKGEIGKKTFYDLVKKADVVYSNYRADVPKRQGTDFETLSKINPRIIRCNISGYGDTGPYIGYPAFDIIACGHSGILSISGEPGEGPLIPGGIALADMMGGICGTMSVLAALIKRNNDGKGMELNVNLLDGLLVMQQVMFQNYFLTGNEPGFQGRRHTISAGYGIYDTKDGYITLASIDQDKVLRLIDLEWVIDDPRFKNIIDRLANKDELDKCFEEALRKRTTEEWLKILRDENDIACGPVLNYEQILNDPQVQQNKMIIEIAMGEERYKTVGSLFRMSNRSGQSIIEGEPDPPPDLNQHADIILRDLLNYSDEQIKKIAEENEAAIPRLEERLYGGDAEETQKAFNISETTDIKL
ncbi:MAG: CoA transferase [Spirochaetota bacterium]|nr:CoA transferase [Spirochaetota bacterium]